MELEDETVDYSDWKMDEDTEVENVDDQPEKLDEQEEAQEEEQEEEKETSDAGNETGEEEEEAEEPEKEQPEESEEEEESDDDKYAKALGEKMAEFKKEDDKLSDQQAMQKAIAAMEDEKKGKSLFEDLEIPEEEITGGGETNFQKLAQSISIGGETLNIEDNSLQALQDAVDAKVSEVEARVDNYNQLDDFQKDLVNHLANNGVENLQNFLAPDRQIEGWLKMSDDDLVKEYIKQSQDLKDADDIEDELDNFKATTTANGKTKFEEAAASLRSDLREKKVEAQRAMVERAKNTQLAQQQAQEEKEQNFLETLSTTVDNMNQYMGHDLTKSFKKNIKSRLTTANVKKYQNSPQLLTEAIIFHNFGKNIMKAMAEERYNAGRNMGLKLQANIPDLAKGNTLKGKKGTSADQDDGGSKDFGSAWGEI